MNEQRSDLISYTFSDGQKIEWTGKAACLCSTCRKLFNSISAFEMHNKNGVCDTSKMEKNSRNMWVTALMTQKAMEARST